MPTPSKFTTATRKRVLEALEKGHYVETAASLAGIGRRTLYDWLQQGKEAERGPYRAFYDAVQAASAKAEDVAIEEARDGTAHAGQWFLERRYPDKWGKKDRKEVTGAGGGPIRIELQWPTAQTPPEDA